MAIKISGNTVIDDSQNITATGSASFGSLDLGSGTAYGATIDQIVGSHSGVRVQSTDAATSVGEFFAGYRGSSMAFQVTTGGALKAASGAFEVDASGTIQTNINTAGIVKLNSTADFANPKIELSSTDGSATFAGGNLTITSAGRIDASEINSMGTAGFYAKSPSDSGYGLRVVDGSNTHVFDVNFQGNVMAKRNVNLTNGYGAGTDGNAALFTRNAANDTTTCTINYDGTATFAGTITAGASSPTTDTGAWIQEFGGVYTTRPAGSTDSAFAGYQVGSSTPTVNIKADGTATFAGTITTAGYSLSNLNELT
tara:strand:+ start:2972 stop:3907 length:936 start_codon:yes stop_codon:yes gene_type:complete